MKNHFLLGLAIATSIFFASPVIEAKNPQRSSPPPATDAFIPIAIYVVYGDKSNQFIFSNVPSLSVLHTSNRGDNTTRRLDLDDYKFLKERITKLVADKGGSQGCERESIEIKFSSNTYRSCLSGKSNFAKQMKEIANLVALLF